jgi:hypothetical protein
MKRISILFYSLLLLVVTSCSPSEEEINAAAKQTVNDFFSAVSFEDMDNINRIYPTFEKINTELKKITFEKVEVGDIKANMDDDDTYSVLVRVAPNQKSEFKVVSFTLKPEVFKKGEVVFQVANTKGLSQWKNNDIALALGCWDEKDNLTDLEYYERFLIADSIAAIGAKKVMKEVADELVIKFLSFPPYKIGNPSKYSFTNATVLFTFRAQVNQFGCRGDVKTVNERVKNVSLKRNGGWDYYMSQTGDAYCQDKLISKEVIIPMEQAKKLYAKTATGNEYAEFMSQKAGK